MTEEKQRINKLVIVAGDLKGIENNWLDLKDKLICCDNCMSPLCYVQKVLGVVYEKSDYGIVGYKHKGSYTVREIQLFVRCAECGDLIDDFCTKFYDDDKIVYPFEKIDSDELGEVEYCIEQFNRIGDFTPRIKYGFLKEMKEKLKEFDEKLTKEVGIKSCSEEQKTKVKKLNEIKIKCIICGKEIVNPLMKQRTCSHKCSMAYQKEHHQRKKEEKLK